MSTGYPICLITDTNNPLEDEELLFLDAIKADPFFDVDVQAWDDPTVDWKKFKSVVIRSAWDYTKHVAEFLAWTKKVASMGVEVINPPDAIEWNSNKRYLLDLANAGVPLLPTVLVDKSSTETVELPESTSGWIVKPTVGSSSKRIEKFDQDSADEVKEYATKLVESGVDALIQPFAEEIASGEVSFVFFGDQYSHACNKTPAKGDFRVQFEYGGHDNYFDANEDQITQARAVLEAVQYDILYARIDMVNINGTFHLMELELIEPYLFFGYNQAPKVFLSVLKNHIEGKRS